MFQKYTLFGYHKQQVESIQPAAFDFQNMREERVGGGGTSESKTVPTFMNSAKTGPRGRGGKIFYPVSRSLLAPRLYTVINSIFNNVNENHSF